MDFMRETAPNDDQQQRQKAPKRPKKDQQTFFRCRAKPIFFLPLKITNQKKAANFTQISLAKVKFA